MEDTLSIDGPAKDLDVFDCPKCGQTIDTSAEACPFCGAKVDHEAAQRAAHLLARVDQACSDASYLRNTALIAYCMAVGIAIGIARNPRFTDRVGFQNVLLGYCALVLLVSSPFPLWTLLWWRKYSNLTSDDDEFQTARQKIHAVGFSALAALLASGAILCSSIAFRVHSK